MIEIYLFKILVYNGSTGCPTVEAGGGAPDTTPSSILELNMSSYATPDVINLTDPFCLNAGCLFSQTNDTTPTFKMRLSEAGNFYL